MRNYGMDMQAGVGMPREMSEAEIREQERHYRTRDQWQQLLQIVSSGGIEAMRAGVHALKPIAKDVLDKID